MGNHELGCPPLKLAHVRALGLFRLLVAGASARVLRGSVRWFRLRVHGGSVSKHIRRKRHSMLEEMYQNSHYIYALHRAVYWR